MPERKTLYTLGGCATYELGKEFNPSEYAYANHFWRRPTLALCSQRISKFRFNIQQIPTEYLNYFINDCSKLQYEELLSQRADSVLVLDLTRDVLAGVIEVEPGCYVLNPLDAVGMVEGLEAENINEEVVKKIYGDNFVKISPREQPEEFFEIWKKHFEIFARDTSAHFDHVILPRLKYTDETLTPTDDYIPGQERLEVCNRLLERMYEFAESLGNIRLISISDNMYSTGKHVEWGGPHIGHYPKETYAALCQRISDALGDNDSNSDHYLFSAARQQSALIETLKDEAAVLKASLSEMQATQESNEELLATLAERNALIETLDDRIAELDERITELDKRAKANKALAEQPLARIAKRRLARRTQVLRSALRSRKNKDHKKLTFTRA